MSDYPSYIHAKVSIGGSELNSYCFEEGPINIGRGSDCQIVLDNPGVSRVHACLEKQGDNLRIKDLESGNGTFVNGSEIEKAWVSGVDTVRVGKFSLTFRLSPLKGGHVDSPAPVQSEAYSDKEGQTIELSAGDRQKILLQAQELRSNAKKAPAAKPRGANYFPLLILFAGGTLFGLLISWLAG